MASWLPPAAVRALGRPAALAFHGVEYATDDARVQANHHDAGVFFQILQSLKTDFDVLPLSALDDARAHPERHRRSVFLTCDDGYANTLTVAADMLKSLDLPWTLFVSTHHIDSGEPNPMFLARLFLVFAPDGRYEVPNFDAPVELSSDRTTVTEQALEQLKALPEQAAAEALVGMLSVVADDAGRLVARFRSESFLAWRDVARLKASGVEIGAHAHVHWAMHELQPVEYLRTQATRSKALIEEHVGPCHVFAYPFGNVGDVSAGAWQAVRDAGFKYGFSTLSGTLDAGSNPYLLPRYAIGPRDTQLSSIVPLLGTGNQRVRRWQRALGR